jgi:hypothetical protein
MVEMEKKALYTSTRVRRVHTRNNSHGNHHHHYYYCHHHHHLPINSHNQDMDGLQLRDEAVRDRIRAAEEFLDPSMNS